MKKKLFYTSVYFLISFLVRGHHSVLTAVISGSQCFLSSLDSSNSSTLPCGWWIISHSITPMQQMKCCKHLAILSLFPRKMFWQVAFLNFTNPDLLYHVYWKASSLLPLYMIRRNFLPWTAASWHRLPRGYFPWSLQS